jgi:hypothetical protein
MERNRLGAGAAYCALISARLLFFIQRRTRGRERGL